MSIADYNTSAVGFAKGTATIGMEGFSGSTVTAITNKINGAPLYKDVPNRSSMCTCT